MRQEKSFKVLKKQFTTKLILVTLDLNKKMRMKVNVLDFATGGVLSIEFKNRKWRPVAYLLKLLNKTERNYEIHNKEILAIIKGLKN